MPHILVAGKIHDDGLALLENAKGFTFDYVTEISHESYAHLIDKADGLVIRTQPLPAETISKGTRLKIVSRHGVGYDAVHVPTMNARGLPLAIVGDVNSRPVAEHAMMLILGLAKRVRIYDAATRESRWAYRNSFESIELDGKALLIIGFGRIGRNVARMASGFGMMIHAYDPMQSSEMIKAAGAIPVASLEDGLTLADFVTIHAPKTGDHPLIGAAELKWMKPTAFIVNTARGGMIDEDALCDALDANLLGGAGIDVFLDEPPNSSHRLFSRDDVILSPHSASLTAESAQRMAVMSVQNVIDYFEKKLDPSLVVNRDHLNAEAREHLKI
jgi:D-3-phosphoglycerate dehydrogenase